MEGKDKIYEVTREELTILRSAFNGYIFRRTDEEGKHWVKTGSPRNQKLIESFLKR